MRAWARIGLVLGGSWWVGSAAPQQAEQEAPDLEFLEYLGAWAAEDDEWLAIEEWRKDDPGDDGNAEQDDAQRKDEDDASE